MKFTSVKKGRFAVECTWIG